MLVGYCTGYFYTKSFVAGNPTNLIVVDTADPPDLVQESHVHYHLSNWQGVSLIPQPYIDDVLRQAPGELASGFYVALYAYFFLCTGRLPIHGDLPPETATRTRLAQLLLLHVLSYQPVVFSPPPAIMDRYKQARNNISPWKYTPHSPHQ